MTRLQNEMEKHSKEKGISLNAYEMMYEQLIYDEKSEEYQEIECKLVMMLVDKYFSSPKIVHYEISIEKVISIEIEFFGVWFVFNIKRIRIPS